MPADAARAIGGERPAEPERRAGHPAAEGVTALASAVVGAAEEDGRTELSAGIRTELARLGADAAAIVVVGEKKRGKSSLVNALVGQVGLLPVDVDVATPVHVVVRHATRSTAFVHDGVSTREIGPDEVADHVAVPVGGSDARRDAVRQVEVLTPSPLLARGLVLVDTPGFGGLAAGHAAVSLSALDRADALVFVTSGHSELTRSELAFLERATERVAAVLFVLTRFDQSPGWRDVLARDRELVTRQAPAHSRAPWFVVNSRARADAERARAAGRPDVAERRLAASGLPELEGFLAGFAADADALRLANVVYRCRQVATALATAAARRTESLTLDPAFAEDVEREKAALTALNGGGAAWRTVLADALRATEQRCRLVLSRQVEDLRLQVAEQIETARGKASLREAVDGVPDRVDALWMTVHHRLADELVAAAQSVADTVGATAVELSTALPDRPARLEELPDALRTRRRGPGMAEHGMMALGLGSVVGSLLSAVTTPVVGIPVGAAVVGLVARIRHWREEGARSQQAARQFLDRVVTRVNTEVPSTVQETVASAKGLITDHVAHHVAARRTELEAVLAERQQLLKAERDVVTRARNAADQRAAERRKLVETAESTARGLASGARRNGDTPA